jgi:hypothetical protein
MNQRVQRSILSLLLLTATTVAGGQEPDNKKTGGKPSTVTLQQMVEPSFRVQPVVHRLEAARGETLPFSFLIESYGREINGEVKPIALRQEETGVVFQDESVPAPTAIKLSSPERFTVNTNQAFEIKGEVTVPRNKAKFHSFGLLVRDAGQQTKFESAKTPDGKQRTQAGVRFVTQYVLRCDIQVNNTPGDDVSNVEIKGVEIVAQEGMPTARVLLENPTDSILMFNMRGRFGSRGDRDAKLFSLIQPSRHNLEGDDRELVKVLPKSRVRIEAGVPNPLFPGKYAMQLQMIADRRHIKLPEVPIEISSGDFPAQETQVVQVSDDLIVSPVQIELGQAKGARRSVSLGFVNRSEEPQEISLAPLSLAGDELPGLHVANETFTLAPGQSRRITLMIRSQKELHKAEYGFVSVTTKRADGVEKTAKLPVAVLYGPREKSQVVMGELALKNDISRQKFVLPVTNNGQGFAAVNAQLLIGDEQGRAIRLSAGYGRWLHPQEVRELEFHVATPLPPGTYQLQWQVRMHEHDEPLTATTVVRIPAPGEVSS